MPEFIAYAKANRVLYGSPGVGNLLHLTAELFNLKAGIKMEHVPYRGASEVLTALMQGSIQVTFVTPATALPLIEQGKLRAIGFNGRKPFPELPDVPLVSASVPSIPPTEHLGIFFAPAKTPAAIVDKLNAAIRHALTVPAVANVVAAVRLCARRTHRGADGGILPQGSRSGGRGGEGRRNSAELRFADGNGCTPCLMRTFAASPSTTKSSAIAARR